MSQNNIDLEKQPDYNELKEGKILSINSISETTNKQELKRLVTTPSITNSNTARTIATLFPIKSYKLRYNLRKLLIWCGLLYFIVFVCVYVSLCAISNSPLYLWFILPILIIWLLLWTNSVVKMYSHSLCEEEFDFRYQLAYASKIGCLRCKRIKDEIDDDDDEEVEEDEDGKPKEKKEKKIIKLTYADRNVMTWRAAMIWLSIYGLAVWYRSYLLYVDVTGAFGGPAKKSSCQSDNTDTVNAYNPNSYYPSARYRFYSATDAPLNCPIGVRWPAPVVNNHTIYGATTNPVLSCNQPFTPNSGYVALPGQCNSAFPDTTLGVQPPSSGIGITQDTILIPGQNIVLCPGVTSDNYPVVNPTTGEAQVIQAFPKLICSPCAGYFIFFKGGISNVIGLLAEYARDCLFPTTQPQGNFLCAFCPGPGNDFLEGEIYTEEVLIQGFWLNCTLFLFLPFIEFIIFNLASIMIIDEHYQRHDEIQSKKRKKHKKQIEKFTTEEEKKIIKEKLKFRYINKNN